MDFEAGPNIKQKTYNIKKKVSLFDFKIISYYTAIQAMQKNGFRSRPSHKTPGFNWL